MSDLLNQLNDEDLDPIVTITDTDGTTGQYEFLDIVFLGDKEYVVVSLPQSDGDVEIFRVLPYESGEAYARVQDDATLLQVFEIFRRQHEDEFDFD